MITGPSVGPAMLLNVLMRWPQMIIVCGLAGGGYIAYKQVDADQYIDSVRKVAIEYGVMKATDVVQAAKKVEVIPAAQAGIAHDGRAMSPLVEATPPTITTTAELTPEELKALQHVSSLPNTRVFPVQATNQ